MSWTRTQSEKWWKHEYHDSNHVERILKVKGFYTNIISYTRNRYFYPSFSSFSSIIFLPLFHVFYPPLLPDLHSFSLCYSFYILYLIVLSSNTEIDEKRYNYRHEQRLFTCKATLHREGWNSTGTRFSRSSSICHLQHVFQHS